MKSDPIEEMAFHRGEALIAWLQQFAPFGVATLDESFRIQSWNHWMELHSGKPFTQVAGRSLLELFPDLSDRRLVPHFERALQGESSVLSTALHRYLLPLRSLFREPGRVHMLQTARIAPLFHAGTICGIVLVIEDVTQRESQADALGRQHRRDELLSWALAQLLKTDQPRRSVRQLFFKIAEQLDFDTFLIYLRNPDTGGLSLDAAGGVPIELEQEFARCPFLGMIPPESQEAVKLAATLSNPDPRYAILRKAGISAAVVIPLIAKERNLGILCFATCTRESIQPDETDLVKTIAQYLATALDRENTHDQLRKAKNELSDQAQHLEVMVRERTSRLQETISELEAFSYTIAHDLRAPVRATVGYCEVLLDDFSAQLPPEAKMVVNRVLRASGQMETLTRDLLEFGRVSQQEVVLTRVEMEALIEEIVALRTPEVRRSVTVVSPIHTVRGHKGLLRHVFSNLIDNAVKFVSEKMAPAILIRAEILPGSGTGAGGACQDPEPSSSDTPPGTGPGNCVRIWVEDRGIGIAREAQEKIFGIFERGVRSDEYQGTGIGLAIVARAMQRMGGRYGVESEPGKGSRFWVELPAT